MKPSNKYKSVFESKTPLTREDIDSYGEQLSDSAKNNIEQKSLQSPFENDAMEGWEDLSYDLTKLKKLDAQFSPKTVSHLWYWVGGSLSILIIIIVSVLFTQEKALIKDESIVQKTKQPVPNTITIESSDLIIPKNIEKLVTVEREKQIDSDDLREDFEKMEFEKKESIKINPLPLQPITQPDKELITNRKVAKEMYISELKVVDYTNYRELLEINSEQITLTGTPANKEDENSNPYELNWEKVKIPYREYLTKTINLFERNEYKKALNRFNTILEEFPDDINAHFYKGMCLFNFGEFEAAIQSFNNCLYSNYTNFDEEAKWLMALAYESNNDEQSAQRLFKEIVHSNGFYTNQAKEKLKDY